MARITLLMPGQSPPQVTMAARTHAFAPGRGHSRSLARVRRVISSVDARKKRSGEPQRVHARASLARANFKAHRVAARA